MKFFQVGTLVVFVLFFFNANSQTNGLATISTRLYLDAESNSINATLDSDTFQTLFSALKATDLEKVLGMNGPFTVFAPTNQAFDQLKKEQFSALFETENRHQLKALLSYHIVAGNLTAAKMLQAMCRGEGRATFTTVQGNKIMATMQGTDIILSDGKGNRAKITSADVGRSNGVIHEIDRVIISPRNGL
ncbi:MAG: fasciclin domain-containing protein [Bacteroidota bacterium]